MTLLVRNEIDVIRKNIEFHLNKGVDFIIATDNGSTDGTRDVLVAYEKKGLLYLIDEKQQDHSQSKWVNRMSKVAFQDFGADFIFHCDADEFWFPKSGDLKTEIKNSSADVLYVNLINVLLENKDGNEKFPEDANYAVVNPIETTNYEEDSKSEKFYLFKYPPKVIFKTKSDFLKVTEGNHDVENINDKKSDLSKDITIYHFPVRGKDHFFRKVKNGGAALESNKELDKSVGWHWRRWYSSYKQGKLEEEYQNLILSKGKIEILKKRGIIQFFNFDDMNKNEHWSYYNPVFKYEEEFQDVSWPWAGHKSFAYDLIANIKPERVVELGTHYGTSLWAFSQAIKDNQLHVELNAVDSWEGEEHAGFYGEEVFEKVNTIKNKFYSDLKINLIRKIFDEAVSDFQDNSVDVLHIDGLHTYEGVKHDFESWLPKMKEKGIVIFHDIEVWEDDFGVHKFWDELKKEYLTIEFYHSFGLGVLFLDRNIGEELKKREREFQMHYSYTHEMKKIGALNAREKEIGENLQEIEKKDLEIKERNREIAEIRNSFRWKFANYFYKIYKKRIEIFVPRKVFLKIFKSIYYGLRRLGEINRFLKNLIINLYESFYYGDDKNPKISIITPTFNSEDDIEECILNVAAQSYQNKEHLIMDGLSTDRTMEIVKRYAEKYPHIKWVSGKDSGIYDAMNKGLEIASGDWIYFLGSDDVFCENNVLERFARRVKGDWSVVYGNIKWGRGGALYDREGVFTASKLVKRNISHQAIFTRKDVFEEIGNFDTKYISLADWAFNIKWFNNNKIKHKYINVVIAEYGLGGFSAQNVDREFLKDKECLIEKYLSSEILVEYRKKEIGFYSLCRDGSAAKFVENQAKESEFPFIYCWSNLDYYQFLRKIISECQHNYAIICHDDVVFNEDFYKKVLETIDIVNGSIGNDSWGLVGNAGVEMITHEVVKYVEDPCGMANTDKSFDNPRVLISVDGNTLLLSISNLRSNNISLPESLSGFHMYDNVLVMECYKNDLVCLAHSNLFVTHKSAGNQEAFREFVKREDFLEYTHDNFRNPVLFTVNGRVEIGKGEEMNKGACDLEEKALSLFKKIKKKKYRFIFLRKIYYNVWKAGIYSKIKFVIFSPDKFIKKYFKTK